MGFDVSGRNPTSAKGTYFRNNVWWWRPLWTYCCLVSDDAASVKHGHTNDGDGLAASKAKRLAAALEAELASGRTEEYAKQYQARLDALPLEECDLCEGTGVRSDAVGRQMGMPDRVIDEPDHPRDGQTGWCNGCNGVGKKKSFDTYYPFSVENVREFAEFVRDSGGFKIW